MRVKIEGLTILFCKAVFMRIETIIFDGLSPFADKSIMNFPEKPKDSKLGEVHLITGENGTGKTRLLCLLAAACGNNKELAERVGIPLPRSLIIGSEINYVGFCEFKNESVLVHWCEVEKVDKENIVALFLEKKRFKGHAVSQSAHLCENIYCKTSIAFAYKSIAKIRDLESLQPIATLNLGTKTDHLQFDRLDNKEDQWLAQGLMNIKMKAAFYSASQPLKTEDRNLRIALRLEKVLEEITGKSFITSIEDRPKVNLTATWDEIKMRLRALPDGLRAILGWLASCIVKLDAIFPEEPEPLDIPLTLFLDEPESHLHPAWQRKVIPALQKLLPNSQIFVATHSPFIISSVNEGYIHILRADKETGIVTADEPRECSKGDTWIDVVEDVLGVREWYDPETEELLKEFREVRDTAKRTRLENDIQLMRTKAEVIAQRSDSLANLMGREMSQFDRQWNKYQDDLKAASS